MWVLAFTFWVWHAADAKSETVVPTKECLFGAMSEQFREKISVETMLNYFALYLIMADDRPFSVLADLDNKGQISAIRVVGDRKVHSRRVHISVPGFGRYEYYYEMDTDAASIDNTANPPRVSFNLLVTLEYRTPQSRNRVTCVFGDKLQLVAGSKQKYYYNSRLRRFCLIPRETKLK